MLVAAKARYTASKALHAGTSGIVEGSPPRPATIGAYGGPGGGPCGCCGKDILSFVVVNNSDMLRLRMEISCG